MTVRTLVLLRHAKADTPRGTADEDRPLSARGHADAQAAGAWLATHHRVPELVLCSPTKRTRQTWHAVAANLPADTSPADSPAGPVRRAASSPAVRYERPLYLGGTDELLQLLREIEDPVASVLVIGHNPALSLLASALDPEGGLDSDGLRTCGLTVHTVDGPWSDCGRRPAPVTAVHTARGD